MKNTKDYKTLQFHRLALSIGAVEDTNDKEIDVLNLLRESFFYLLQNKILTKNQKLKLYIFKDQYNRFLQYCIDNNIVTKGTYREIKELNTTVVPDMSHIKIPNLEKELKEMGTDLDKLANTFVSNNIS